MPSLWTFDEFLRDKAHRWVGAAGEAEYAETDRRRAMEGQITPSEGAVETEHRIAELVEPVSEEAELERFGRAFGKKYWQFEDGWINLNHGQRPPSAPHIRNAVS